MAYIQIGVSWWATVALLYHIIYSSDPVTLNNTLVAHYTAD